MYRCSLLKASMLAIVLCMGVQGYSQSYVDEGDMTIYFGVGGSKMKSNYKNYDSDYKPPDWWATLWAWAKAISGFLYGSGKNEIDMNETEGYPFPVAAKPASKFSYGVGLGIGTKGGKFQFGATKFKHTIYYLELPVVARYNHALNNGDQLFAAAGPYFALALAGRAKSDNAKESLQFGSDDDSDYRRGDWGAKIMLGYKSKTLPVSIGLTTEMGMRNLTPNSNTVKIKNRLIGIEIGYGL